MVDEYKQTDERVGKYGPNIYNVPSAQRLERLTDFGQFREGIKLDGEQIEFMDAMQLIVSKKYNGNSERASEIYTQLKEQVSGRTGEGFSLGVLIDLCLEECGIEPSSLKTRGDGMDSSIHIG